MSINLETGRRERIIEIVIYAVDKFLQGLFWGAGLVSGFMAVLWFINTVGEWLS